ncbi:MAG: hypothetical protein AB7W59_18295 [Acidimicrobiia bacterium]
MTATIALDGTLGDAVYLGITAAFFGLAALLVEACRRIAGDDPVTTAPDRAGDADADAADNTAAAAARRPA